ncbi:MAG: sugar transferase, partial [Phenylobacterium sp.]
MTYVPAKGPLRPVTPAVSGGAAAAACPYPAKRLIDALIAASALFLLAPLMMLLWLLVVATSRGPGLFWSQRVGRNGRLFWMPKYRTMANGAPLSPREALAAADSHITAFGAVLRRSGLDEL